MVRSLLLLIVLSAALPRPALADAVDDLIAYDQATGGQHYIAGTAARARAGDGLAQLVLGYNLVYGRVRTSNVEAIEEGAAWLKRAADNGKTIDASFMLASLYDEYGRLGFNPKEAAHWYERAFDAGSGCAAWARAGLFFRASARLQQAYDRSEEMYWYEKCAEKGVRNCQGILGGYLLGKDYAKALHWLMRSIEPPGNRDIRSLGHSEAAIGMMHQHGLGTAKDLSEAVRWYSLAIENESEYASWALAELMRQGELGPPDLSRAAELYEQAAKRRHQPSQYRMGLAWLHGNGVRRDPVQAIKWLTLAIDPSAYSSFDLDLLQRDPALFGFLGEMSPDDWAAAVAELATLRRTLELDQFEAGQKLAAEFEPIYPPPPRPGYPRCE